MAFAADDAAFPSSRDIVWPIQLVPQTMFSLEQTLLTTRSVLCTFELVWLFRGDMHRVHEEVPTWRNVFPLRSSPSINVHISAPTNYTEQFISYCIYSIRLIGQDGEDPLLIQVFSFGDFGAKYIGNRNTKY